MNLQDCLHSGYHLSHTDRHGFCTLCGNNAPMADEDGHPYFPDDTDVLEVQNYNEETWGETPGERE